MAYVDPRLLAFARSMRLESAPAEQKLWRCLRARQLNGFKLRRQHSIDPFIADFCCVERKFVIELDGDSHDVRERYDSERTAHLQSLGYTVLRFSNVDVFENLDGVLMDILDALEKKDGPHPGPLP